MVRPQEIVLFFVHVLLVALSLFDRFLPLFPLLVGEMEEELVLAVHKTLIGVWDDLVHDGQLVEAIPLECRHRLQFLVRVEGAASQ